MVMQTHKSKTLVEFNATVGSAIIAVDLRFFTLIKKRNLIAKTETALAFPILSHESYLTNRSKLEFPRFTGQKMKISIKGSFSKCDQIRRKLRVWSHLLKKSPLIKSSHLEVFCEKGITKVFLVNFAKFLRTLFFYRTPPVATLQGSKASQYIQEKILENITCQSCSFESKTGVQHITLLLKVFIISKTFLKLFLTFSYTATIKKSHIGPFLVSFTF